MKFKGRATNPMPLIRRCLSRIFEHALWRILAGTLALGLLAFFVNTAGIWLLGGVNGWVRWFHGHRIHFLFWRLCVYGVTVAGWLWMRRRIVSAECDEATAVRLIRAEVAAMAAVVLIEATILLQST